MGTSKKFEFSANNNGCRCSGDGDNQQICQQQTAELSERFIFHMDQQQRRQQKHQQYWQQYKHPQRASMLLWLVVIFAIAKLEIGELCFAFFLW